MARPPNTAVGDPASRPPPAALLRAVWWAGLFQKRSLTSINPRRLGVDANCPEADEELTHQ